jgi:hypothetical protein
VPQGNNEDFINHCFDIPADHPNHQELIYNKMIARYAGITFQQKTNFTVFKEKNNIPYLYCRKEKLKIPVSITHHGNYAAFTIN